MSLDRSRLLADRLPVLREHAARCAAGRCITRDPAMIERHTLRVGAVQACFARQGIDAGALDALLQLAAEADLAGALRALVDGAPVNASEGRAALHTALRADVSATSMARQAHADARAAWPRMAAMAEEMRRRGVRDVVSVGIGGSDLGPRLVVDALAGQGNDNGLHVHVLANVDGHAVERCLAGLDPATTAVLLVSKSFRTGEVLANGALLRQWLDDDSRLYAVTAEAGLAEAFGVAPSRILPMWDWVGGRYSLWSAVGMPIVLAHGMPVFERLLAGAAAMDRHALDAPLHDNLPVRHALVALWNRSVQGHATQAVMAYDQRLQGLVPHLQQLAMESLGKSVRADGTPVAGDTGPVWWGGVGTGVQHSVFQALHQGTSVAPVEFIGVIRPDHAHAAQHALLLANLLAQSEALATGVRDADPHRAHPGGRPSTVLLLDALTPEGLGQLLALYEHSVYLQAVLWGVNAFDQYGVELGKRIAGDLQPLLAGTDEPVSAQDPVTAAMLGMIRVTQRPNG
jgi:glucose-6-phosphate isomerase